MKRLAFIVFMLALFATSVAAQTRERLSGWCERGGESVVTDGRSSTTKVQRSYQSCTVTVFVNGTVTPATIYSDYVGTPKSNPFTALTNGYWDFVADAGRYDLQFTGSGISPPIARAGLWVSSGAGGGTCPGSPVTGVQYNKAGACFAESEFIYLEGSNNLKITSASGGQFDVENTTSNSPDSFSAVPGALSLKNINSISTLPPSIDFIRGRDGPVFPLSGDYLGALSIKSSDNASFNEAGYIRFVATQNHSTSVNAAGLIIAVSDTTGLTPDPRIVITGNGVIALRHATATTTTSFSNASVVLGTPNTIDSLTHVIVGPKTPGEDHKIFVVQGSTSQSQPIFEAQNSVGTALYNISAIGAHSYAGTAGVAISAAGQGRIYFDQNVNKFQCSENGTTYFNCFQSGSVVSGTGTTNRVPLWTTSTSQGDSIISQVATTEINLTASSGRRINLQNNQITVELANEVTTGTTANRLAKLTGAPSTAILATTSDTIAVVGVVVAGAGTTGAAQISVQGRAACQFDGATTAGNYVTPSVTTNGQCHDGGSSYPVGSTVIGRVLSTNGGAGTYDVWVFSAEERLTAGGGGTPGGSNGQLQWNNAASFAGMTGSVVTANGELLLASAVRTSGGGTRYFAVRTPADTTLSADAESIGVQIAGNASAATVTRQFTTGGGAFALQREIVAVAPTYAASAATETISLACTFCITGAPAAGPNMILTESYALHIDSGVSEFNGDIVMASAGTEHGRIQPGAPGVIRLGDAAGSGGGTLDMIPGSPANITTNQNDYTAGGSKSLSLRLTSDASRNITGLSLGQSQAEIRIFANVGSNNIVFTNQDSASSAVNRIITTTGASITMSANEMVMMQYDPTTQRWRASEMNTGNVVDPGANGIVVRTGLTTSAARTLTGTTNQVIVSNGDGTGGNPTFALPQSIDTGATVTFSNLTVNSQTDIFNLQIGGGNVALVRLESGSATIDFGNLTAQNTGSFTITISGASVGDYVLLEPPSSFAPDIVLTYTITSANTLTVFVKNDHASSANDPPSASWRWLWYDISP